MKNKLLEKITAEQLIEDFKQLGTAGKIAEKYCINIATVYTAFNIIDYDCRVNKDIKSIVTKDLLEEAYNRLGSLKAVGRELKISHDSVKFYMKKFGLEYREKVEYDCDHKFFSRDNQESFYVAGFIAADGCVKIHSSGNSYQVQIGLSKNDKEFLDKIKNILSTEAPIRDFLIKNSKRNSKWNDTECSQIAITSRQMFDDLARFNIVPRKSLIYTFPEWMKEHPLKHHFIRGYNDGDGSFFIPKTKENKAKQLYFSLRGTPEFLKEVRYIFEKECDLPERDTEIRISSGQGALEYGGNGVVNKIVDYLYKDASIYLDRKYQKAIMLRSFTSG